MDIPFRKNSTKIVSPPLTFIGDDSAEERRTSLALPMQEQENIRSINLGDPIDAVSCNKSQNKIVCAGSRGVLRIFEVTDNSIIPLVDLKKVAAKNKSKTPLLYSPSNVAWSKLREDLLATTSTIGAVVLWNIDQQKIETFWKAHTRSATVVRFHRHNSNVLISGSKDSRIFVYDIREDKPVIEIKKGIQETVQDLMFSQIEGDDHHFLSGDDGGIVKVWDLRNPHLPQQSRQLHQGYISCIQSHSKRPNEVATGGGRDKQVKIWNWKDDKLRYRQVETYAPVGRINWRPDNEHQFATCAVVHDVNILIWDIRRPHLPMISFPGHKDRVTDVFWSRMEPHRFVSVGKEGLIILHNIADGDLTIDHLCDAQIDVAPDGLIAFSLNAENEDKKKPRWEVNDVHLQLKKMRNSSDKRREAAARVLEQRRINNQLENLYEPFSHNVKSDVSVGIPSSAKHVLQNKLFEIYARHYIIGGRSIDDMCEHNAAVCRNQGDEVRERIWRYVAGLLAGTNFQDDYDKEEKEEKIVQDKKWNIYIKEHENQGTVPLLPPKPQPDVPLEFLLRNRERDKLRAKLHPNDGQEDDALEFFTSLYPNCDYAETNPDALKCEVPNGDEFCGLPEEAFGIKRYFQDLTHSTVTEAESWRSPDAHKHNRPEHVLIRQLHYLAHQGDIQMCASISTIAGRRLTETLSAHFIDAWTQSYIDMLYRLQLFVPIAALRKYTCIGRIRGEAGDGTFLRPHVWHTRRNPAWGDAIRMKMKNVPPPFLPCKGKLKNGNCDKCCEPLTVICALCDEAIHGITWNCIKCGHSMHLDHAFVWFRERVQIVDEPEENEDDMEDLEAEVDNGKKPERRRQRIIIDDEGEIQDLTQTHCPVPNCKCDCLEETDFDEIEKNASKPESIQSVDSVKKTIFLGRYKPKPVRRDSSKEAESPRTGSLLDKFDLRFRKPIYDFVPKKASLLREMDAAAQTEEENQLCSLLKMTLALPNEYKPQLKKRFEQPPLKPKPEEDPRKRQHIAITLGLVSKEKLREQHRLRKRSRNRRMSERDKFERRSRALEQKQMESRLFWKEAILGEEESDSDEDQIIMTGEKDRLYGDRESRPKNYDIIRCVFWGLLRRLKKVQRRKKRVSHRRRKEKQKAFFELLKRMRRKKKRSPLVVKKFLEMMAKRQRKKCRSLKFIAELKKANCTASTMVHFVGLRMKPKFIKRGGRMVFARLSVVKRARRKRHHHIIKVFAVRRFTLRKGGQQRKRKTFPIMGAEPEDLIPTVFEDVRARKITTARNTNTSSCPVIPYY